MFFFVVGAVGEDFEYILIEVFFLFEEGLDTESLLWDDCEEFVVFFEGDLVLGVGLFGGFFPQL